MKKETKKKGLSAQSEKKLRKTFEELIKKTEQNYDKEVTLLLNAISSAEKKNDAKRLDNCKKIALTWLELFEFLKKNFKKEGSEEDGYQKFIDEQIKFFKILSKEIDRSIKNTKYAGIRKKLE